MKKIRLQEWDYSWNGTYFVTINTKNNIKYFGEIGDKEMQLSTLGKIVNV